MSYHNFITLALTFLVAVLPHTVAIDLQCADSTTFRVSSSVDAGKLGLFCCPHSHPLFNLTNQAMNNPPQYNYTNENGTVYASLPVCSGCPSDSWRLCRTSLHYPIYDGPYVCCPPDSTCPTFNSKCFRGADTTEGNSVSAAVAVPVADMDLCRYKQVTITDANGTQVTTTVPGSPCDPEFECEAYSQTQYRCTKCKDPRYGPPGDCKIFTCPAGSFCRNMTAINAYGSAPFSIAQQTCANGTYCPVNSTHPIACPPGLLCQTANLSAPSNCSIGSYCPDALRMVVCPRGAYCATNSLAAPVTCSIERLEWCPDEGMTAPSSCPRELYCPDSLSFEICPFGWSCVTGSPKTICPAGTYSDIFSNTCRPCPDPKFKTSDEGATSRCDKTTPLLWFCSVGIVGLVVVCLFVVVFWKCCNIRRRMSSAEGRRAAGEAARMNRIIEEVQRHKQASRIQMNEDQPDVRKGNNHLERRKVDLERTARSLQRAKVQFATDHPHCKAYLIGKLSGDIRATLDKHFPGAARIASGSITSDGLPRSHLDEYMKFLKGIWIRTFDSPEFFDASCSIRIRQYYSDDFYLALTKANPFIVRMYSSFPLDCNNILARDQTAKVISTEILKNVRIWREEVLANRDDPNGDPPSVDESPIQLVIHPEFVPSQHSERHQELNPNTSAGIADVPAYIYPPVAAPPLASSDPHNLAEGIPHEAEYVGFCIHAEPQAEGQTIVPGGHPIAM